MVTDARRLLVDEPALADDHPHVAGSLQRLCRAVVRALPAAGVGVSLMSPEGAPVSLAASDATSHGIGELQFMLGEGPCQEAFTTRRPVLVPDLMEDGGARWPGYASAARAEGVGAVFAFILQVGAARLGVLDIYRRELGALSAPALGLALTFAELAVELLLDAQQQQVGEDRTAPPLDDPLGTGFELYQAQGMVMYQLGVDLGEAMSRVRAYAFAHDRRLGDVAADIVDRRLVLEADGPDDGTEPNEGNGR
jgi:hypothetical protein